jgi:pimeloyl-ACP methyl ester carboxylesterase
MPGDGLGHPGAVSHRVRGRPDVLDTHLEVGGRRVRVLSAASRAPAASAEPQLLVHGLGGSAATWVEVMAGLAEHGPVVALDLPGFGRTAPQPDDRLTVRGYVDVVLEAADALGWESFALHGNSMGGLIGTVLAARHPGRVSRLVLVSPALPPRLPVALALPSRATLEGMLPVALSSLTAAALGAVGLAGPSLSQRRDRAMLQLIFPDPDRVDRRVLDLMAADLTSPELSPETRRGALLSALGSIAATWTDPRGVWRAVRRVQAPTLLLGGTADALVPARTLRAVLAARPDWEGHVLDDRRHVLMLEDPEGYLELVAGWRRRTDAAA